MKKEEKASISIMRIICISIILILISGIGVMAVNPNLKDVKIILQNGYEMTALTGKETVSEILEENNIVLEENKKIDSVIVGEEDYSVIELCERINSNETLEGCKGVVYKENGIRYEIEISYSDFGMLQHICENSNIEIKKVDYSQDIKVVLDSTKEDKNYLINNINVKKICIKEEKVVIKLKNIQ